MQIEFKLRAICAQMFSRDTIRSQKVKEVNIFSHIIMSSILVSNENHVPAKLDKYFDTM